MADRRRYRCTFLSLSFATNNVHVVSGKTDGFERLSETPVDRRSGSEANEMSRYESKRLLKKYLVESKLQALNAAQVPCQ